MCWVNIHNRNNVYRKGDSMAHHEGKESAVLPSSMVEQLQSDLEVLFFELEKETDSIDVLWRITSKKKAMMELLESASKEQHLTLRQISELESTLQSLHDQLKNSNYSNELKESGKITNEMVGYVIGEIEETQEKMDKLQSSQNNQGELLSELKQHISQEKEKVGHLFQIIEDLHLQETHKEWKQALQTIKSSLEALENGCDRQSATWATDIDELQILLGELLQFSRNEKAQHERWSEEYTKDQQVLDSRMAKLKEAFDQLYGKVEPRLNDLPTAEDLLNIRQHLQLLQERVADQTTLRQIKDLQTELQDLKDYMHEYQTSKVQVEGVESSLQEIKQVLDQVKSQQEEMTQNQLVSLFDDHNLEITNIKGEINNLNETLLSLNFLKKEDLKTYIPEFQKKDEEIKTYLEQLKNYIDRDQVAERTKVDHIEKHMNKLHAELKALLGKEGLWNYETDLKIQELEESIKQWKHEQQSRGHQQVESNQELINSLKEVSQQVDRLNNKVEELGKGQSWKEELPPSFIEYANEMEQRFTSIISKEVNSHFQQETEPRYLFSVIENLMKKVDALETQINSNEKKPSSPGKRESSLSTQEPSAKFEHQKKEAESEPKVELESSPLQESTPSLSPDNWFYHSAKNARETQRLNSSHSPKKKIQPKGPTTRPSMSNQRSQPNSRKRTDVEPKGNQGEPIPAPISTNHESPGNKNGNPIEDIRSSNDYKQLEQKTSPTISDNQPTQIERNKVQSTEESKQTGEDKAGKSFLESVKNFFIE